MGKRKIYDFEIEQLRSAYKMRLKAPIVAQEMGLSVPTIMDYYRSFRVAGIEQYSFADIIAIEQSHRRAA